MYFLIQKIVLTQYGYNFLFVCRLNHVALLQVLNHSIIAGSLDSATITWIQQTLDGFVSAWQQAEEKARKDDEEKASLYKFKPIVHGDGMTDDEREEIEFVKSYPSYQQVW